MLHLRMEFDLDHMTTASTYAAIDSLEPLLHHSLTHIGRNVGNFAFDILLELVDGCWHKPTT